GELAHQQHKRANKSSSGRDAPAHYARHANTGYAFNTLAGGIQYDVTKYNRRIEEHKAVTVGPEPGCSRGLQALRRDLASGLARAPYIRAA
ncbi:MAG: hypothetical protein ABJ056_03775, partial [Halioglobus sp.]